jgi:hypothetical protein
MTKGKPQPTSRAKGRPPKGAAPALPAEEVDRLLVFGEVVTCDDGSSQTVTYPSYRDLAERFGVSTTLIAKYSKDHNCIRRREQAKARIQAQADQKLVELRATAVALSKDDELRIIDTYLAGFEKALAEGRVRFDNPGDFNTMVRLKEFVMGGADSRQEIHASLSLEDIQARHQRMIRVVGETSSAVRGELPGPTSGMVIDAEPDDREGDAEPPRAPTEGAAGDLNVHLRGSEPDRARRRTVEGAGELVGAARARDAAVLERGLSLGDYEEEAEDGATPEDDGGFSDDEPGVPQAARVLPRPAEAAVSRPVRAGVSSLPTEVNTGAAVHLPARDAAAADDPADDDGR